MMNRRDDDGGDFMGLRATPLERHLQSGIGVILIGLVGWIGISVSDTTTRLAVLENQVATLNAAVTDLRSDVKASVAERYTATDARRDFSDYNDKLNRLRSRVDALEKK